MRPGSWLRRARTRRGAFTWIDLLALAAFLGIVVAFGFTTTARARAKGQGIVCQNNLRRLTQAWTLYAREHGDRLVANRGGHPSRRTLRQNVQHNWANNVLDWELSPDNTNSALLRTSALAPYVGPALEAYLCPADHVLSQVQRRAGWTRRVRSFSMNAMVGDAGESMQGGANLFNPDYRQFRRLADFPDPAQIFVFLDEHPDSVNDGAFLNRRDDREWTDLPASYHNAMGSLAFADGHAEGHRWRMAATRPPPRPDAAPLPIAVPEGAGIDFDWLMERTSVPR